MLVLTSHVMQLRIGSGRNLAVCLPTAVAIATTTRIRASRLAYYTAKLYRSLNMRKGASYLADKNTETNCFIFPLSFLTLSSKSAIYISASSSRKPRNLILCKMS